VDLGLSKRVVLITGAGGGAGPTVARAFADEGAFVALQHREGSGSAARAQETAADIVAAGGRAIAVSADLTSTDQVESMVERVDDLLGATFRACRAVVPGMQEAGWGRIVNVAARSGLVGVARSTHYAAAKAGIVGLTASLAKEFGPQGILVNAVAPTTILTVKDGEPSIPDERVAEMAKSIPLRRLATPDDLARLVVWLGSDANSYVSGQTISLSGGDQR
jgi:3-oxoacyl-[acyl-carrier protein] reductase